MKHLSPPFHFYIIYSYTNNTPHLTELTFAFQRQQMHLIFHSNPNFGKDDICFGTSWDLQSTPECPTGRCDAAEATPGALPHLWSPWRAPLLHPTALHSKNQNQTTEKRPQSRETSYTNRNNVSDDEGTTQMLY